jgi:hypothetical protein
MRLLVALTAVLGLVFVVGCGDDKNRDVDPTPENQFGAPSGEFETEDINAAESASDLVETYCDGAVSEAQMVGCLSHVSDEYVCEQDTDGKRSAVEEYIDETGDESICD